MNPIKLVMCDLDDTLLRKDKSISTHTIDTIKALKIKGIRFGIATGRSLYSVSNTLTKLGIINLFDVIITMNGTQKKDLILNTSESFYHLSKARIVEITEIFAPLGLNYCIYDSTYVYAQRNDDSIERIAVNHHQIPRLMDIHAIPDQLYPKVILIIPEGRVEEVAAFYIKNPSPTVRGFFSRADLFEYVDANVSKSYAINAFCLQHGFTLENVMAFGDTSNDIEMLEGAKIGVCVSNGTQDAKDAADFITDSCDDDGVAVFLKAYFKLESKELGLFAQVSDQG